MGGLVKVKVYVRCNHLKKVRTICVFSSFCEKLLLKMGKNFQETSKKRYVRIEVGGRAKSKGTRAYRVGGFVQNVTILSVHALWVTPWSFSPMADTTMHGIVGEVLKKEDSRWLENILLELILTVLSGGWGACGKQLTFEQKQSYFICLHI